jgi:predicted acyltransferase
MVSTEATDRPQRLISLDAFRGITIAGMIMVNNPGSWSRVYGPLGHAQWNGWTPTDLVFPFFLFIVGVAMTFSFKRRSTGGQIQLLGQVARRTIILFLLGLIMAGFPNWRLIGPYLMVIVGLGLLFWDEPVLSLGADGAIAARKIVAGVLLVAAVVYFVWDFSYFQAIHPPAKAPIRVPGVLQRIALCYFFASLIVMTCGVWGRAAWALVLVAGYWLIVKYLHAPDSFLQNPSEYLAKLIQERPTGVLHDWIDVNLLGQHLYSERPEPEGLLSTLPAIATTLAGILTGHWLQSARDGRDKVVGMFFVANLALVAGLWMNYSFPVNKKIWTSSYVVLTAGLALHFLAMCYWLIDVKGYRRWSWPFLVFGSNAIVVYVASGLMARMLGRTTVALPGGGEVSVQRWLYEHLFASWAGEWPGSLFYALVYVALWLLPMIVLYRKRIFVKI